MNTIIAFGDSIMQGVVYENGRYRISKDSFIHLCEKNTGASITNLARFGHKVTDGQKVIKDNLSRLDDPDVKYVLLEFGGNDCDFNWKNISDFPDDEHLPATDILHFSDTYFDIIEMLRSLGKQTVILSLPPINSDMYFSKISAEKNPDNILRWLKGDIHFISDWHESYNLEVLKIAAYSGCPLIDITSEFLRQKNMKSFLSDDGIHPNESGHRLIAQTVISQLYEFVFR